MLKTFTPNPEELRTLAQMLSAEGFTVQQNPPPMLLGLMNHVAQAGETFSAESRYLRGPEDMHMDERHVLCAKLDAAVPFASGFLGLRLFVALDEQDKPVDGFLVVGKAFEALLPHFNPQA